MYVAIYTVPWSYSYIETLFHDGWITYVRKFRNIKQIIYKITSFKAILLDQTNMHSVTVISLHLPVSQHIEKLNSVAGYLP